MKLSIIIPVYNTGKYINECLDSITKTEKDIEVILVDDGSKDNSLEVCKEYSKTDKRIKVFHKENGGVSSARNYGIEKASGDYIAFLDSDDKLSDDWDKIIGYLDKDDIYYFTSVNPSNKVELIRYITGINDKGMCIASSYSKAFKREFLNKNKIRFNELLINGEDMLFNVEVAFSIKSYKFIDFHFCLYRQMIGQSTRKFNEKIIDTDLEYHKELSNLFEKYKFDKDVSEEIKTESIKNGIIMILRRISYITKYGDAKEFYNFINNPVYKNIIDNNNSHMFKKCRKKKFRYIYYYYKVRNKLSLYKHKIKNKSFIEI